MHCETTRGLDRSKWEQQVAEALGVLRKAEAEFKSAGYEVESLRITTQPVGELVSGLSEDDAVAFLARFDQMVWRPDPHSNRGLTAFGVFMEATSGQPVMQRYYELGLLQQGDAIGPAAQPTHQLLHYDSRSGPKFAGYRDGSPNDQGT